MSIHVETPNAYSAAFSRKHEEGNIVTRFLLTRLSNWQKRRMIAAFERLDDRILADIGLTRGDIPNVIEGLEPGGLRNSADGGLQAAQAASGRRLRQFA